MTINEYLNQLTTLERRADSLYNRYWELQDKATAPNAPSWSAARSGPTFDAYEKRMVKAADAFREYADAFDAFKAFRQDIKEAVMDMPYWQAEAILAYYVYDRKAENRFTGLESLFGTADRKKLRGRLNTATEALRQKLINQGIALD